MRIHYKRAGAVSVIFGICLLIAVAFVAQRRGWSSLLDQSDLWLVRYSIPILFLNFPILFIVSGIVMWLGILPPYNAPESTSAIRAKASAFAILFTLPVWISLSLDIYISSDNPFWVTVWTVFMGYLVFSLMRGVNAVRRTP